MSKLKVVSAQELERLLLKLKFTKQRQKGSHATYSHGDGRSTTIPFHGSKDLPRPLIRAILNEIDLSIDDYNNLI